MKPQPIKSKSKVYVVQCPTRLGFSGEARPTMDFTDARQYGDVDFLLPDHLPEDESIQEQIDKVRTKLAKFGENDFLILVGHPVFLGVALYYAAEANHGRAKVLRWHRGQRTYRVMQMVL